MKTRAYRILILAFQIRQFILHMNKVIGQLIREGIDLVVPLLAGLIQLLQIFDGLINRIIDFFQLIFRESCPGQSLIQRVPEGLGSGNETGGRIRLDLVSTLYDGQDLICGGLNPCDFILNLSQ